MKKLFTMCLAAVTLAATVAITASAAAADWNVGNGFHLVNPDWSVVEENTPVVVTDAADGVQVTHGGAYQNGKNWGGVASKEAYNLNGLEVTVRFDTVPAVTAENDCWLAIDFLEKGQLFDTQDIPGNRGFMTLMRFGRPYLEVYDGAASFSQVYNTQSESINDIFGLVSGDVVKWTVAYEEGVYKFTFTKNDGEPYTVPSSTSHLADVFKQGKAHIAIAASLKESTSYDTYTYTILSVKDGVEKTAEEIAAEDAAIEAAKKAREEEEAKKRAEEEAKKQAEAEAKAAEEAAKAEEEANKAAEEAVNAAEEAEEAEDNDEEKGGSNIGLIIAIIAIIVVVIAVVAVVLKKKKN